MTILPLSIRQSLCRLILGKDFFNADASLEIDRLTAELDRLKEEQQEEKQFKDKT